MAHYRKTIEHDGRQVTLPELERKTGIGADTLRWRYKQGDRGAELVRPLNDGISQRTTAARAAAKEREAHAAARPRMSDCAFAALLASWKRSTFPWMEHA